MSMHHHSPYALAAVLAITLPTLGACSTFKTCSDARIDLVNSGQNGTAVHVVPPGEDPSPDNLLEPGESRRIEMCLHEGDRRGFRVVREGDTLAQANCVASRSNYEALVIQVLWSPSGLSCPGW
jgi:hypothetical protein